MFWNIFGKYFTKVKYGRGILQFNLDIEYKPGKIFGLSQFYNELRTAFSFSFCNFAVSNCYVLLIQFFCILFILLQDILA